MNSDTTFFAYAIAIKKCNQQIYTEILLGFTHWEINTERRLILGVFGGCRRIPSHIAESYISPDSVKQLQRCRAETQHCLVVYAG